MSTARLRLNAMEEVSVEKPEGTLKKPRTKPLKPEVAPYVIVRGYGAGVHAGELHHFDGSPHVTLLHTRRIWRWEGAASLSELALYGSSAPKGCKIAVELPRVEILDACEINYCGAEGELFLRTAYVWRA